MICRSKGRGESEGQGVKSKRFIAIAARKLIAHVIPLDSSRLDVSNRCIGQNSRSMIGDLAQA